MRQKRKNQININSGFTLIEILTASVLMVAVAGGFLTLQYIISRSQVSAYKNYLGVDSANVAVATMVRELRNARPGDNGAYALESALDQQIVFYSDIDQDNLTERIRYFLNGNTFSKGVIEPVGTPATYPSANEKVKELATNVQNGADAIFFYYNGDWPSDTTNNPLPAPARLSETKIMRVYLRVNQEENEDSDDFILESYVTLRSLKVNL